MVVFATKHDDAGTLFQGTLEECHEYIDLHDLSEFDTVNIDQDDGIILERIKP